MFFNASRLQCLQLILQVTTCGKWTARYKWRKYQKTFLTFPSELLFIIFLQLEVWAVNSLDRYFDKNCDQTIFIIDYFIGILIIYIIILVACEKIWHYLNTPHSFHFSWFPLTKNKPNRNEKWKISLSLVTNTFTILQHFVFFIFVYCLFFLSLSYGLTHLAVFNTLYLSKFVRTNTNLYHNVPKKSHNSRGRFNVFTKFFRKKSVS